MSTMQISDIIDITRATKAYNFHGHTQFCDARNSMEEIALAARDSDHMLHFGFSPHSPINVDSPCNMSPESVEPYLQEVDRLREIVQPQMQLYASMEIDYISDDFGPHIDYFQKLPLDYRIGSVHFVPSQDGIPIDCDGSYTRFAQRMKDSFRGDLRYVVETYFIHVIKMLERGGFEMLGHLDKIALNAAQADPDIEQQHWYEALVDDVISHAESSGVVVEINTKHLTTFGRFFPAERWWDKLLKRNIPLAVNSDVHYTDKVNLSRADAFEALKKHNYLNN